MKKLILALFAIGLAVSFSSCGSDDPAPAPIDYTLKDKSEIMGTQTGKVEVSLSPGAFEPFKDLNAKTIFAKSDEQNLSLIVPEPTELGGPITASNFLKTEDGKEYTFAIANFPNREVLKGGELPAYINTWFPQYADILTKIIIKDLKCGGAKYDKATASISFTYTGTLEVYVEGEDTSVASNTITYKFTQLKK